ncbi:MAG: HupE/UreJ family protein [Granulosicoccus sp.]|nr:HupE/UreJ family protein [Granulosicoccus sp.]
MNSRSTTLGRILYTLFVLTAALFLPLTSLAHAPNENYVWVNVEEDHISGRFELNYHDVKNKLGIDVDALGSTRLDGVQASREQILEYLQNNFSISEQGNRLQLEFGAPGVFEGNRDFLQFPYRIENLPSATELSIRNTIFMGSDVVNRSRLHRSLIVVEYNEAAGKKFGEENVALVFSPANSEQTIDLTEPQSILLWKDFLWQGILHIAFGLDHVLFVVLLLLSAVLRAKDDLWQPQERFTGAFLNTIKIVTLFTIAHSITLSLAALDFVSMNTMLVESVIALSIIAVALHNIFPRFGAHTWVLIFVFGLFHGLGFATVMGDLQFRTIMIKRILVMFNVGVEIGQLIIVCIVFPVLFLLRKKSYYRSLIVLPISLLSMAVAMFWLLQRVGVVGT